MDRCRRHFEGSHEDIASLAKRTDSLKPKPTSREISKLGLVHI